LSCSHNLRRAILQHRMLAWKLVNCEEKQRGLLTDSGWFSKTADRC
jgi:hypothetical protein